MRAARRLPSVHRLVRACATRSLASVLPCVLACVVAAWLAPQAALAQSLAQSLSQLHHQSWNDTHGMDRVGSAWLARTSDGYLWLSGVDNLQRFDGVRFVTVDSGVAPALRSNSRGWFTPMLVDRRGRLWISRPDGAVVRYEHGRFTEVVAPESDERRFTVLSEDGRGRIWGVRIPGGTAHLIRNDSVVPAPLPPDVLRERFNSVVPDTGTGVWFGSFRGVIHHFDGDSTFRTIAHDTRDDAIRPVLHGRDGALWLLGDGLQRYVGGRFESPPFPGGPAYLNVSGVSEDANGAVWIASRGRGVIRWQDGAMEQFTERDGLSDAVVHAVLHDAEGNHWSSTDAGLDRLRPGRVAQLGPVEGVQVESPLTIDVDVDGSLWVKTYGNGLTLNVSGGLVGDRAGPATTRSLEPPIAGRFWPLWPARAGGVWIYDERNAMYRATARGLHRVAARGLAPKARPFHMAELSDGTLWMTYVDGPFGVVRDGVFTAARLTDGTTREGWAVVADADERVYVTVRVPSELAVYDRDRLVRQVRLPVPERSSVYHLAVDGRDTVWALASDGVLMRVIGTRVDVLRDDEVAKILRGSSAIMVDGDEFVFASVLGIAVVSRAELHAATDRGGAVRGLRRLTVQDGFRSAKLTAINSSGAVRARDGRVWFATPGGLAVLGPPLARNDVPPPVHIEEVLAGERRVPLDSPTVVPARTDRVDIRFTAASLRDAERVRVEYRLDGVDPDWRASGAVRMATYTLLRPGRYTFRVRAWNEDGVPSEGERVLALRVLPAWYESWWFRALAALVVIAATAALAGQRVRARHRAKAERMQARFDATLSERTRVAGELHDTLLQGFTGITLQLQAVRQRIAQDPAGAADELGRVLGVADGALREARQTVWDMRAPELEHADIATALARASQAIVDAAPPHPERGPLTLHITVNGTSRRYAPAAEVTALRVGREAVTNAVRHAKATRITLDVTMEERRLVVVVQDDGVGFDVHAAPQTNGDGHWGLVGMRERASRVGAELRVTSGAGEGTRVELTVDS